MQRTVNLTKYYFKPTSPLLKNSGSKNVLIVTRPISSLSTVATSEAILEEESPILIKKHATLREMILNNPSKMNPLTPEVTNVISSQLKVWEESECAKVIIVKGSAGQTFSIGGDYKEILDLSKNDKDKLLKMIESQYQIFHTIANLRTAYIAIMDGVTMGEGAALSINGGFRVATENTRLSIPELTIGLTPNAGCNYYMSRLDGQLGTYLTLTGQPMSGQDLLLCGLATHYIPSSSINQMENTLTYIDRYDDVQDVNDILEQFSVKAVDTNQDSLLNGAKRETIERCFGYDTVEEIISALEKDRSDFALETRKVILSNSPTATKLALEKLRLGRYMNISDCLKLDFEDYKNLIEQHDFKEGVTSRMVNKSQPNWNPSQLNQINNEGMKLNYLNSVLAVNETSLQLPLQSMFKPTASFALPTEDNIRRYVVGLSNMVGGTLRPATSIEQVVLHFVNQKKGKVGVTEKIKQVLDRKTRLIHNKLGESFLEWNYNN